MLENFAGQTLLDRLDGSLALKKSQEMLAGAGLDSATPG